MKARKIVFRRALCMLLSGAMIGQVQIPVTMAAAAETMEVVELLTNGDFSDVNTSANTAANWEFRTEGNTTYSVENGSATYQINMIGGVDWVNYLKYTPAVSFTAGKQYTVSVELTSTADRTVRFGFDDGRMYMADDTLQAGQTKVISNTFTATTTGTNHFMLYLGLVDEADAGLVHDVTISNVSITTDAGSGNAGGGQGTEPTQPTQPTQNPVDSSLTTAFLTKDAQANSVEGNLIVNGNFNDPSNALASWNIYNTNANFYTAESDNRAVLEINNYAADWQQGLMQTISLDAGTTYVVSFDAETTGTDVNIVAGMDPARDYATTISAADGVKHISYEYKANAGGNHNFFLFLGNNANCGIAVSNVSVAPKPVSFEGASDNDVATDAYAPITSLAGTVPAEDSILKDGNFTSGLSHWDTWCESWMSQYNVVQYTPLEKGMNVWITNTGGDEGNKPWDVQLNQTVTFKAGKHYVLKGTVTSEKARAINLVFNDAASGNGYRSIQVGLQAGKDRELYYELPVFEQDTEVLFSIQMGNVAGDVQRNNIVFKDLLIEVNGYTALAEVVTADAESSYALSGVTSADGYLTNPAGVNGTVTIPNVKLAANSGYDLSFVSGTRGNAGTVTATVYGGNGAVLAAETYDLGHAAEVHTMQVQSAAADDQASVVFTFNGTDGAAYLDSIAMYANGYAAAMGLNVAKNDITPLNLNAAPAISEALVTAGGQTRFPLSGEDVVLTYAANATYQNSIQAVTVNGTSVPYTLGNGTITIPASAFAVPAGATYESFDIVVTADWFTDAVVYQSVYNNTDWVLSWSDEFDGTTLDLSKWSYQNGTGAEFGVAGWGNNEQQYYTDENIEVKDGKLVITATEGTHGMPYDSGRIWTMSDDRVTPKFAQTYGRFEAKISLPTGNGIWPAFWMLPAGSVYGGWPLSGELDIMEARGRLTNTVCGTLHYGKNWPNNVYSGLDYYFEEGEDYTPYHIYAAEWEPGEIRWYVDGELYQTQNSWYSTSAEEADKFAYPAPFNQEFYIILNLAVGGTFDGNINPDASDLPGEMCVDYVRAYTSTKPLDEFVAEPEIAPVTVPAGAKDGFANDKFANINIMKADQDVIDMQHWNLLTLPSYGGAANFSTTQSNGETVGKIAISSGGSQSYSVQMINMVSLYKGHYYKLSFDAKADAARNLITKIGDDGNPTWDTFYSAECKLDTEWDHYEVVFQMPRTEETARVELNMGLDATDVYLKNAQLEEVDASAAQNDPDCIKNVNTADNHVYNGTFNVGAVSRLDFWHTTGDVSAIRDAAYDFICQINGAGTVSQTGIRLTQNDTYRVTFDAEPKGNSALTVTLGGVSKTVALDAGMHTYTVDFDMPQGNTAEYTGTLEFAFTGAGALLDNVAVTQETYNNVDFTQLNCYPLTNGDFEAGKAVWGTYGTDYEVRSYGTTTSENGALYGAVKKAVSGNTYDAMLNQSVSLLGGYTYEFSFDAWSDTPSQMDISMEDGSYTRFFEQTGVEVGTGRTHYAYTFKLASDMDLSLKFMTGKASVADYIYLDNVELKIKGATPRVGTITVNNNGTFNDGTSVKMGGADPYVEIFASSGFQGNAVIYVDGNALTADQYTVRDGKYYIHNNVFAQSKVYEVYVGAEGYVNSNTVEVAVYPADGNGYCNGTFDAALDGYGTYLLNGDDQILADDGFAALYYSYAGYDEWGNIIPWSIQLTSQKVQVTPGTPYTFSFYAYSEVERCIRFTLNNTDVATIKIGTQPQVYSFTYTPTTDVVSVMIQAGSVNEDGSYVGREIYDPHFVYLDNFCAYPTASGKVASTDGELNDLYANGGIQLPTQPEEPETPEQVDVTTIAPEGVKAVYENGQIVVTWDDCGAARYKVSRSDGRSGYTNLTYRATAEGYADAAVDQAQLYYYRITPYFYDENGALVSGKASEAAVVVATDKLPDKVVNVTAEIQNGSVILNWDRADGARYYKVSRATGADGKYFTLKYNILDTTYTDDTISSANKLYRYKVVGYYKDVDGGWVYGDLCDTLYVRQK